MQIIDANLSFGRLSRRGSTSRIILHHAEASSCTPQQIHQWHKANGWSGAGYHFLVRKDGTVYSLRPEWALGAHAAGNNYDSLGVCFEGAYMRETMGQTQIDAGRELVAYLKAKYGISKVQAHRDVCPTDCPGTNFPFDAIAYGGTAPANVESAPAQSASSGDGSVAEVQRWLGCEADGIYGPDTKRHLVRKLQHELNAQFGAGLADDGYWGPKTRAACVNVRRGARGNITRVLQGALICHGYSTNGFDGIFGGGTESAVRSYQSDHGLAVDGIAGRGTFGSLLG